MPTDVKNYLSGRDPILADIIARIELPDLEPTRGVYHDLVSCIVDQQIPARTRGTYMKKLTVLLKGELPDGNNIYTIQPKEWSAAKMAINKYYTLFRMTDYWHEEKMESWDWDKLPDEEIFSRLTSVKGIGPQTGHLILLYSLGRADIFPVGDYHLKQIMEKLYLKENEKLKHLMLTVAEKWVPYRSVGTRYLLAYKAQMKKG